MGENPLNRSTGLRHFSDDDIVYSLLNITNQINQQGNNYMLNKEGKEVISILNKIYEHSTEETRLKRKYDIYCTITK